MLACVCVMPGTSSTMPYNGTSSHAGMGMGGFDKRQTDQTRFPGLVFFGQSARCIRPVMRAQAIQTG
jgi:hypothetical protein